MALGGGAGNLIRRKNLEAIGYFGSLKQAVVDDIALAQHVRRAGGVTRAVRADTLIRVRMYHGAREIAEGFTKNVFFAVGRSYVLGVLLIALFLVGNLLPFALALTGDWIGIATVAVIVAIRVVLFRALRYSMLNALFLHPLMMLFWLYVFVRSMWFTGVRRQLQWRGRTYDAAQKRFGA